MVTTQSAIKCAYICYNTRGCQAANYQHDNHMCVVLTNTANTESRNGSMYIHI